MRGVTLSTLRDATDSVLTCICGGVADHSLHAIRSMQAMANFFVVHEARQNTQHFASEQAREAALLYNWSPVGPKGDSYRAYMFPSWQPPGDSVVEGFTQPSKK
eukprot:COSAG05_NODE_1339_length_5145_cov_5.141102_3_plen_104_part_00